MCKRLICLVTLALILSSTASAELVGWWKLDETEGTIAADSSGNGNDGTLVNGGTWTSGYVDGALQLDGTNQYVNLPIGSLISTLEECTFAIWVNWSGEGGGWQRFIDFGTGETNYIYICPSTGNTNALRVAIVAGNSIWNEFDSNQGALPPGEWRHVSVTVSSSAQTMTMYVNGVVVGSANNIANVVSDLGVTTQNWLGRSQYGADPYFNGILDDLQIYNETLSQGDIQKVVAGLIETSSKPNPPDAATDVRPDMVLSWQAGQFAASHDVYFGTNPDDVANAERGNPLGVLVAQDHGDASYDPAGVLELGQTYYWRVDEVNAAPSTTIFRGDVWSFTAEPVVYPVANVIATSSIPSVAGSEVEKIVDGSGLTADGGHSVDATTMWQGDAAPGDDVWLLFEFDRVYKIVDMAVWNYNHQYEAFLGFGLKDVTVEYSTDASEWTTLGDYVFAQASSLVTQQAQVIDFGGLPVRYVRFDIHSNRSLMGQLKYGLSEVQFRYLPVLAREPQPADGATDVDPDAVLGWRNGREVVSHQVYLNADSNAVADDAALVDTTDVPRYDLSPLNLELAETYYWKITEVNEAATPSAWASDIWSFSTLEFRVVDDFESYTDEEGNRVFDFWLDGYEDNANGSLVGHENPPYAEQAIVQSGLQSMPFTYGANGATTSEAELSLGAGQDWTRAGATTLVLYFRGALGNDPGQLYIKVNGTRKDYDGSTASLAAPVWKQWNVDLAALGATSVRTLVIGVSGSGTGTFYVDDIRLYRSAPPATGPAVDPGTGNLVALYTMENTLADASGNGRDGTAAVGSSFGPGPRGYGQAIVLDGVSAYVTLPIGPLMPSLSSATVATWVNWSGAGAAWQRLFDFGSDTDVYMFLTPSSGATMRFAITTASGDGESALNAAGRLPTGWHHVAVSIDGTTSEMALYLDGNVAASGTTETLPADLGNTTQNWIGRSQYDVDPYIGASVDDFRIYNRALSGAEVRYLLGDR